MSRSNDHVAGCPAAEDSNVLCNCEQIQDQQIARASRSTMAGLIQSARRRGLLPSGQAYGPA